MKKEMKKNRTYLKLPLTCLDYSLIGEGVAAHVWRYESTTLKVNLVCTRKGYDIIIIDLKFNRQINDKVECEDFKTCKRGERSSKANTALQSAIDKANDHIGVLLHPWANTNRTNINIYSMV